VLVRPPLLVLLWPAVVGLGAFGGWQPRATGAANPPPAPLAEARGDLDGDGKPERIWLGGDGALHVEGTDGAERGRLQLPASAPIRHATLAVRDVEEHAVLHARAELGRGQAAEAVALLGGGKLGAIFVGRTGPIGDGERAERLRVDENGVVRYQTAAGMSRCDGNDLLFPERWDFGSGRFRPVMVDPPSGKRLRTSASPPGDLPPAPLGLFQFVAESTDPSAERHADRLAAPHELDDGRPATSWRAGIGPAARGAWVTARAEGGGHHVRDVRGVHGPRVPPTQTLIHDGGRTFTV
jgi:hypothetical protein